MPPTIRRIAALASFVAGASLYLGPDTGINTLRIYSPRKQALDHDPEGRYQRRWIPELGTPAYLQPIVDERSQLARTPSRRS